MVGNVYVKFLREEDAEKAVHGLENRWLVLLLFIWTLTSEEFYDKKIY